MPLSRNLMVLCFNNGAGGLAPTLSAAVPLDAVSATISYVSFRQLQTLRCVDLRPDVPKADVPWRFPRTHALRHTASVSSRVLASFRSSVSKPSVNRL